MHLSQVITIENHELLLSGYIIFVHDMFSSLFLHIYKWDSNYRLKSAVTGS